MKKAQNIEERMKQYEAERELGLKKARMEAESLLKQSEDQALRLKQEIMDKARVDAEQVLVQAAQSVELEKQKMLKEVKAEVADLVVFATEKILKEKVDEKKDHDIISRVLEEIKK